MDEAASGAACACVSTGATSVVSAVCAAVASAVAASMNVCRFGLALSGSVWSVVFAVFAFVVQTFASDTTLVEAVFAAAAIVSHALV